VSVAAIWTGTLRRGTLAGTVTGEMRDKWGYVVTLSGTRQDDGSYTLAGRLEVPKSLGVVGIDVDPPAIDREAPKL
jgi:hypothetical protein